MRLLPTVALASFLALAALAVANPIVDVSQTSINVSEEPKNDTLAAFTPSDDLKVTVERMDELVSGDGDLIAARVVDVEFHFDVDGDQILLSGVPIELGISSVQVNTAIIANRAVTLLPADDLATKFDRGIATIEIGAQAQAVLLSQKDLVQDPSTIPNCKVEELPDMIEVRRIMVNAHILEINGKKVVQTDLIAQVFDVFDGYVARGPQQTIPFSQGLSGMTDTTAVPSEETGFRVSCLHQRKLAAMWHRLPHRARVVVATFLGSLLILVFFVALPLAIYVQWKERRAAYERVQLEEPLLEPDEDDDLKFSDEKMTLKERSV